MKKILYNSCYGGFCFSKDVLLELGYENPTDDDIYRFSSNIKNRTSPRVITVVEKLGLERSSGLCSKIAILEVHRDDVYEINDIDGKETLTFKCNLNNDSNIIF